MRLLRQTLTSCPNSILQTGIATQGVTIQCADENNTLWMQHLSNAERESTRSSMSRS